MKIRDLERRYKIGYRHSPNDFHRDSFQIDSIDGRLVIVGIVKRKLKKRYRVVGVIKSQRQ